MAGATALGIAALASGLAVWAASDELAAPTRRELQDYHRELLHDPAARGLSVRRFPCGQNTTACLLVEPDARAGLTARTKQLRSQLRARGLALPVYGNVHGILVLLHGRKGRKEDLLPVAERFAAAGFRSVIPDLPAHGRAASRRSSSPATSAKASSRRESSQKPGRSSACRTNRPSSGASRWAAPTRCGRQRIRRGCGEA
jgi:hypothetical protein